MMKINEKHYWGKIHAVILCKYDVTMSLCKYYVTMEIFYVLTKDFKIKIEKATSKK